MSRLKVSTSLTCRVDTCSLCGEHGHHKPWSPHRLRGPWEGDNTEVAWKAAQQAPQDLALHQTRACSLLSREASRRETWPWKPQVWHLPQWRDQGGLACNCRVLILCIRLCRHTLKMTPVYPGFTPTCSTVVSAAFYPKKQSKTKATPTHYFSSFFSPLPGTSHGPEVGTYHFHAGFYKCNTPSCNHNNS